MTDFKVHNVGRTQRWVSARGWVVQIGDAAQTLLPSSGSGATRCAGTVCGYAHFRKKNLAWASRISNYSSRLEPVSSPKAEYNPTFLRYKYIIKSRLQHHNPDHSSHHGHNTDHVGGGGSSSIESGRASRGSRGRSSVTSVRGR